MRFLSTWFDIRPGEGRSVILLFSGAFVLLAYMILGRSIREAIYLGTFPVTTLPYVTAGYSILALPAVALLVRQLSRRRPLRVMVSLLAFVGAGMLGLAPWTDRAWAVVFFYFWTSISTLLLTSGFWVVTADSFNVRGAKRLFGLIAAGGTLGAMLSGTLLSKGIAALGLTGMVWGTAICPFVLLILMALLPSAEPAAEVSRKKPSTLRNLSLVWRTNHLRTLAWIVIGATAASTLLDYQFKDFVRKSLTTKAELAGFFGSFYGWTGAVSLFLQLVVASRLLSRAGLVVTLSVLPLVLASGSVALFLVPGIFWAVLTRGADNSLRKSLHRSAIEVAYVPLPADLRRRTKSFIDSVLDAAAEAGGAGIIFLWVTFAGFSSRSLSVFVLLLAASLLFAARKMGVRYFDTLRGRLEPGASQTQSRDPLDATFTHLTLPSSPVSFLARPTGETKAPFTAAPPRNDLSSAIEALARDGEAGKATERILAMGAGALSELARVLRDTGSDFVIRRRIPPILVGMAGEEADRVLLDALGDPRFEVRFRSCVAFMKRRALGMGMKGEGWKDEVWRAVSREVNLDRPVWEMQRVLDQQPEQDGLVIRRLGVRGELSLEHTFRLLSLVLDPEPVRTAYRGILSRDEGVRPIALEYLEHVLPAGIRTKLWPFIGDLSELQRKKSERAVGDVIEDLLRTGATLFSDKGERAELEKLRKVERGT
jgi:ATP/ADP translocase